MKLRFSLDEVKSRLPNIHKQYQDLKNEIKEVIVENDRMAFHVKQRAFSIPGNSYITVEVMNVYTLFEDKAKEWQIWENFNSPKIDKRISNLS